MRCSPCPLAHPLRVDRCRLDARDDAAIVVTASISGSVIGCIRGATFHQHGDCALHRLQHLADRSRRGTTSTARRCAVPWRSPSSAPRRPARAGGRRSDRVDAAGDQRHDTCAVARGAGERADIVRAERQRDHAEPRHAGLRWLDAGDAAGRRRQLDRAAGVGTQTCNRNRAATEPPDADDEPPVTWRAHGFAAVAEAIVTGGVLCDPPYRGRRRSRHRRAQLLDHGGGGRTSVADGREPQVLSRPSGGTRL